MLDRLIEILSASRTFELPDLDVSKAKARESLFQRLKSTSAEVLAKAIKELPMDVMKNIVNVEFTGKKARERDYILAQLMVTLIRISDMAGKYDRQMHHPRRKVVNIIEILVAGGETLDWTKAAKNGFTLTPASPPKSSTEAVDFFTGDTLRSLKRRLKGYGIKPAGYNKLFGTTNATLVDTEYSEKQRQGNKTGGQIENAPRKRGLVLLTEEKKLVKFIQEARSILSSIDVVLPQFRLLASVLKIATNSSETGMKREDVTKSLKIIVKVRESLMDVRVTKADRLNISKVILILGKVETGLGIIRSRPTGARKPAKVEASVILRRLQLLAS